VFQDRRTWPKTAICHGLPRSNLHGGPEPAEKARKARVAPQGRQVWIAPHALETAIAPRERLLERRKGRVDHAQDRVAARKVVPCDGVIGDESDQAPIELKSPGILTLGGQVVPVHAHGVHEIRIALEDAAQKLDFKVELSLFAQAPRYGFRRGEIRG
jgi:hypothetical protein